MIGALPLPRLDEMEDVAFSGHGHGDLFYRGATKWQNLAAGEVGHFLQSGGPGADPAWVAIPPVDLSSRVAKAGDTMTGPLETSNFKFWPNGGTGSADEILSKRGNMYLTASGNVEINAGISSRAKVTSPGGAATRVSLEYGGASGYVELDSASLLRLFGNGGIDSVTRHRFSHLGSAVNDDTQASLFLNPSAAINAYYQPIRYKRQSDGAIRFSVDLDGKVTSHSLGSLNSSGTDVAGTSLTLAGGRPTGSGIGGSVIIQTAPSGSTGSTLRTPANRFVIDQLGKAWIGETAIAATYGTLHVVRSLSGVASAADAGSILVLERGGTAGTGISLLSPNTSHGDIVFGDPENNAVGLIQYNHPDNSLRLGVNGPGSNDQVRIGNGGQLMLRHLGSSVNDASRAAALFQPSAARGAFYSFWEAWDFGQSFPLASLEPVSTDLIELRLGSPNATARWGKLSFYASNGVNTGWLRAGAGGNADRLELATANYLTLVRTGGTGGTFNINTTSNLDITAGGYQVSVTVNALPFLLKCVVDNPNLHIRRFSSTSTAKLTRWTTEGDVDLAFIDKDGGATFSSSVSIPADRAYRIGSSDVLSWVTGSNTLFVGGGGFHTNIRAGGGSIFSAATHYLNGQSVHRHTGSAVNDDTQAALFLNPSAAIGAFYQPIRYKRQSDGAIRFTVEAGGRVYSAADLVSDDAAKGVILKNTDGNYYRYTSGIAGALVITNLGATLPA